MAQRRHMAIWIGIKIGWRHQAITKITSTNGLLIVWLCGIDLRTISPRVPKLLFSSMSLNIILLKLLPYLPWDNGLTWLRHWYIDLIPEWADTSFIYGLVICPFFSSTDNTVSGAYPMPSIRRPSVCLYVRPSPTFLPLSPPGWRGIVVTVRAGGRSVGRLPDLRTPYLCNRLTDFLHSKFRVIVYASSCALSWLFTHLPHMGLPTGQKPVKFATNWIAYLWNRWMNVPRLKFHGLV